MFRFTTKDVFVNGQMREYKIVDHPGGAGILVVEAGRVLLIKQYRPAVREYIWEVPAGILDTDEEPLVAAKRELAEETGYTAKNWKSMGRMYPTPGYTSEILHLFVAQDLIPGEQHLDDGEELEVHWFTWDEVKSMLANGQIMDGKTVLLLLQYELLQSK